MGLAPTFTEQARVGSPPLKSYPSSTIPPPVLPCHSCAVASRRGRVRCVRSDLGGSASGCGRHRGRRSGTPGRRRPAGDGSRCSRSHCRFGWSCSWSRCSGGCTFWPAPRPDSRSRRSRALGAVDGEVDVSSRVQVSYPVRPQLDHIRLAVLIFSEVGMPDPAA